MYNGYRPDEAAVLEAGGHARNSIHNLKNGIFTRGILMDIPRLKGVPYLEPETPIYVEDLEAWEAHTGVRAGPGDAVFIRTGRWAAREVLGAVHHRPHRGPRPACTRRSFRGSASATSRCSAATAR